MTNTNTQPGAAPATGNTEKEQEMYAAGLEMGEANAKNNAAIRMAAAPGDAPGTALPPLDADLIEILGRPNFMCGGIATLLRADGHDIKRMAEHEQAATIHFLLGHYLKHGPEWREAAGSALDAIASQRKGDGRC